MRAIAVLCRFAILSALCGSLHAQAADDPGAALRWRLVGPFRGGWATMADGIADQPNTFYFGAAGGGVWKTDDAGATQLVRIAHEPLLEFASAVYEQAGMPPPDARLAANEYYRSGHHAAAAHEVEFADTGQDPVDRTELNAAQGDGIG